MGEIVFIMTDHHDVSSVLVACIEWLKIEATRIKYLYENVPGRSRLIKWMVMSDPGYDTQHVNTLCDQAITAVKCDDIGLAQHALLTLKQELNKPLKSHGEYGGKEYSQYLDRLIGIIRSRYSSTVLRNKLISLWFDMVHGWRKKSSKGVPSVPDLSKFMVIEWVFTIGLFIAGVIVPTLKSNSGGFYLVIPAVYFLLILVANAAGGLIKNASYRFFIYFWVVNGLGFIPVSMLQDHISRWILWSWSGGVIVGVLIGNHLAYTRSRRMATKHGPFGCLWARHQEKNKYEFLMIKTDGTLAWHYQTTGWFKHINPVLGVDLTMDYRFKLRQLGFESRPCGGWFPCYPALIATRMVGLRRRNPVDWNEAHHNTPGLTKELIDQFFAQTPTPLGPPKEYQDSPITELPNRKTIPW